MAQPSVLIVESGSGEVFIVEDEENDSQVDRILREAEKTGRSRRSKRIKAEIKEEPEDSFVKWVGNILVISTSHYRVIFRSEDEEEENIDELLEEMMSDGEDEDFFENSPARPDIPFVDSCMNGDITPKREFPEDIKINTNQQADRTFDGRWSSDEEEIGLEDFADDDISDLEIKQAVRDNKPRKTRMGWGKQHKNNLKGKPICKYCEFEFWTFRAKVEHMEVCKLKTFIRTIAEKIMMYIYFFKVSSCSAIQRISYAGYASKSLARRPSVITSTTP